MENITNQRKLLGAWVGAIPLGYVAVECGWIVREVGRQPWIIHGLLRTEDGASPLPAGVIGSTLTGYTIVYLLLMVAFIVFARRLLYKGPDLEVEPQWPTGEPVTTTASSTDQRQERA